MMYAECTLSCYPSPPQANLCQQSYNSSASCKAKPYCVWEFDGFDGRNVCQHRDTAGRGTDAFSQEYAAIKVGGYGGGWVGTARCMKTHSRCCCWPAGGTHAALHSFILTDMVGA